MDCAVMHKHRPLQPSRLPQRVPRRTRWAQSAARGAAPLVTPPPRDYDWRADIMPDTRAIIARDHPALVDLVDEGEGRGGVLRRAAAATCAAARWAIRQSRVGPQTQLRRAEPHTLSRGRTTMLLRAPRQACWWCTAGHRATSRDAATGARAPAAHACAGPCLGRGPGRVQCPGHALRCRCQPLPLSAPSLKGTASPSWCSWSAPPTCRPRAPTTCGESCRCAGAAGRPLSASGPLRPHRRCACVRQPRAEQPAWFRARPISTCSGRAARVRCGGAVPQPQRAAGRRRGRRSGRGSPSRSDVGVAAGSARHAASPSWRWRCRGRRKRRGVRRGRAAARKQRGRGVHLLRAGGAGSSSCVRAPAAHGRGRRGAPKPAWPFGVELVPGGPGAHPQPRGAERPGAAAAAGVAGAASSR